MSLLMLNFRLDGVLKPFTIEKRKTVRDLYQVVRQKIPSGATLSIYLVCGDLKLEEESSTETIESLNIQHGAFLDFCVRSPGGSRTLQPLPGYIEVTTAPCDVSCDDDPSVNRAKMPCGCVIGPEELKRYCNIVVNGGKFIFSCPNCDNGWQLFVVRHVLSAAMKPTEMETFNRQVNDNLIASSMKIQPCPECKNFLERDPTTRFLNPNWVQCSVCTARKGARVEFCWVCRKPWRGDKQSCGNAGCTGKDPRIHHLQTCETKTIGTVSGVPSVRCCVKCGTLINHTEQCKHMTCKCGHAFCFVCLKPKTTDSGACEWQCGSWSSPCTVAPRQTKLFEM